IVDDVEDRHHRGGPPPPGTCLDEGGEAQVRELPARVIQQTDGDDEDEPVDPCCTQARPGAGDLERAVPGGEVPELRVLAGSVVETPAERDQAIGAVPPAAARATLEADGQVRVVGAGLDQGEISGERAGFRAALRLWAASIASLMARKAWSARSGRRTCTRRTVPRAPRMTTIRSGVR